jgi:hypothetical protein
MNLVKRNLNEFQTFLEDVKDGMTAIQSAATAMAVAYATADGDSANSINAVDFAFADGSVPPPQGFPKKGVSTLEAQQQAAIDAAGGNTLASMAASDLNSVKPISQHEVPGGWVYTYSDNSSLQIITTSQSIGMEGSWKTTKVTVSDIKGTAQVTTDEVYDEYYTGNTTKTQSIQSRADGGAQTTATTAVTTRPDGSVSVTTSGVDATGKPLQPTTINTPPPPKDTGSAAPAGSVKALEDEYGAKGRPENFQQYGQY